MLSPQSQQFQKKKLISNKAKAKKKKICINGADGCVIM